MPKLYTASFAHSRREFSFHIEADSFEEAESIINAMRETLTLDGEVVYTGEFTETVQ